MEAVNAANAGITTGPAKWAAVALLSALAGAGLTYGLVSRGVSPASVQRPQSVEGVAAPVARVVPAAVAPPVSASAAPTTPAPVMQPEPVAVQPVVAAAPEPEQTPPPAPPAAAQPAKINLNTADRKSVV